MNEKSISMPESLYQELEDLRKIDDTILDVIVRLVEHYKKTTQSMSKILDILRDDSLEWKQLEGRINKKLSFNDVHIIYQWRNICQKLNQDKKSMQAPKKEGIP